MKVTLMSLVRVSSSESALFPKRILRYRLNRRSDSAVRPSRKQRQPNKKGERGMGTDINNSQDEFAAFVGIDWAERKHVFALQHGKAEQIEVGEIENTPEA